MSWKHHFKDAEEAAEHYFQQAEHWREQWVGAQNHYDALLEFLNAPQKTAQELARRREIDA